MITENYTDYPIIDNERDRKKFEKQIIGQKIVSVHLQSSREKGCCCFIKLSNNKEICISATSGDFNAYLDFSVDEFKEPQPSVLKKLLKQINEEI